jgi:hypothetical protein
MKYDVEVGSGAMIYLSSFHKDWFRHSKANGRGWGSTDTQTPWRSVFFFQNKESRI